MGKQTSTKPVAGTLKVSLVSDTGLSSSDLVTSNGATLATRAYATDVLGYRMSADGGVTWSAWTATSGAIPAPSSDGSWMVQVRETTTSGKLKGTTTLTFKLDTAALAPTLTLVNDTGAAGDGITQDGSVLVGGLEGGARVEYSGDGGATWHATFAAQEGANSLLARQVDIAGNVSAPASLAFTLDTTAPTALADTAATVQDTPVVIDPLANDGDATGISLQGAGTAAHGSVTLNADGTVEYAPDAGYVGTDSFSYTVTDAAGLSSTANVDVAVSAAAIVTPPSAQPFTAVMPADTDAAAVVQALLASNAGIAVDAGSIAWRASGAGSTNFYDGSLTPLAIGAGLLLTSGTTPGTANTMEWFGVDNADYTDPNGFDNGDTDLDAVVNTVFSTVSYDATTLSFDFEVTDPTATSISFDIVFGSDEFPEWVDQFVDLAIVMVNGQNVALFDHDPMHPLSVIGSNLAGNYFIDNGAGVLPIEYDGVSARLKIVAPVHAGTNSLKIAVGDTGDHIYDSGIFIANLAAGTLPGNGMLIDDGSGSSGQDACTGGAGSELIDLQGGNDSVNAGAGDDVVVAGDGDDVIAGGTGSDVLAGGAGADEFDYSDPHDWAMDGLDTITDFAANTVALDNAPSVDAIDGDVLVFSAAVLSALAGAAVEGFALPSAGSFSTLGAGGLSMRTDGLADEAHAQFVYDSATGLLGFDADGTGVMDALGVTLIGTHPAALGATAFVIEG